VFDAEAGGERLVLERHAGVVQPLQVSCANTIENMTRYHKITSSRYVSPAKWFERLKKKSVGRSLKKKVSTKSPQSLHKVSTKSPQSLHKVSTKSPQSLHKVHKESLQKVARRRLFTSDIQGR
jgi:hypothetical protein